MRLKKNTVIAVVAMAAFLCIVIYICGQFDKKQLISTQGQSYEKAVVTEITKDNLEEDGNRYGNQEVRVKLKSGTMKGETVDAINPNGTLFGANCTEGMNVIVIVSQTNDTSQITVYSQDRTYAIYGYLILFAAIVCVIGGKKGIQAILSLVFTFVCIYYIMFPCIYRGMSPIIITIIISVLATVVTLGMLGGISKKTFSAIAGTGCGVVIAAVAAVAFGKAAGISGYNVTDIETLNFVGQNSSIKIGQLLFSGIIISSLGAVMDVGMSIASTIQEIHETDETLGRRELFLSGIHVGRDMMGTMTNTLILAFVGGSITTLIINYAYNFSYNQLINSYTIGIEIMQGLSGSLGVVLAVPITAFLSAFLLKSEKRDIIGNR